MLKWLIPVLMVTSCSVRVINFTNEDSDFKSFDTFTIVNLKSNQESLSHDGEKILISVERAILDQMNRRGYSYSASEPNLVIRYEIISNQETDVSYNSTPFSAFYGPSFTVRTFLESALLLEMTDLSKKRLVWQASVDMKNFDSLKNQDEMIEEAVRQLFDTYLHKARTKEIDLTLKQSK